MITIFFIWKSLYILYVGELKEDSSNIRDLVSKAYNSLRGKVVIEPKIQADFIDKVLLSSGESMCEPQTGVWTEGLKCDNVLLWLKMTIIVNETK